MVSPKAKPNKQKRIPKSKSLWPSMPRKVTWERSGSFKLASPAACSARAEAVASSERSEEHTSELQSHSDLVCRLLLEKKKKKTKHHRSLTRATHETSRYYSQQTSHVM